MSQQRCLRSNRKILPDVVPVMSVKTPTAKKTLFRQSGDLSNTPKESESEDEIPNKKPKKKTIRRTQNSFYIENEGESAKLRKRPSTEQSNIKMTRKVKKLKDYSFNFETSSDNDSVFEGKGKSSKKTVKIKKTLGLPKVKIDDFQHMRKDEKKRLQRKTGLKSHEEHSLMSTDSPKDYKKIKKHLKEALIKSLVEKKTTSKSKVPSHVTFEKHATNNKKDRNDDDKDEVGEDKENISTSPWRKTNSKSKKIRENKNYNSNHSKKSPNEDDQEHEDEQKKVNNENIKFEIELLKGENLTHENGIVSLGCFQPDVEVITQETKSINANSGESRNISRTSRQVRKGTKISLETLDTSAASTVIQDPNTLNTNFGEKMRSSTTQNYISDSETSQQRFCKKSYADTDSLEWQIGYKVSKDQKYCSTSICMSKNDESSAIVRKNKSCINVRSTSEGPVRENGQQGISEFKNNLRHSDRTDNKKATRNSGIKVDHVKQSFSNYKQEALVLEDSISSTSISQDVQHISHSEDSSSDSEIEFNYCPKNALQSVSDFCMTTENIEESTTLQSNAEKERESNVSINVASTLDTLNNYIENPQTHTLTEQNSISMAKASDKGKRKRWTILEGKEARRSFHMQIENVRKSMIVPKKNQDSLQENHLLKPKRPLRKRWSDELKKSLSSFDVSIDSQNNFDSEKDTHEMEIDSSLSKKSRRSRSLISVEASHPYGLDNSRERSSGPSVKLPEQDTSVESNQLDKNNEVKSLKMDISNNDMVVSKPLVPSVNEQATPLVRKSIPATKRRCVSVQTNKDRNSTSTHTRRFSALVQKAKTSPNQFHNSPKRRTFGIEKTVNDIVLLKSSTISSGSRRSSSLANTLDSPCNKKSFKSCRLTPYLRKSNTNIPINDVSNISETNMKPGTSVFENSLIDIDLLPSPIMRRSRSLISLERNSPDELDNSRKRSSGPSVKQLKQDISTDSKQLDKNNGDISIKVNISNNDMVVSKPLVSSVNKRRSSARVQKAQTSPNQLHNSPKRRTFEIEKNVNDIVLLKSSGSRRSSSLADTLDSPPKKSFKSYRRTPYLRKSNPNIPVTNISETNMKPATSVIEKSLNDIDLLPSPSIPRSSSRVQKAKTSPNQFHDSPKRRTFEIEKTLNDIVLLKSSTISSGSRNSTTAGSILKRRDTYELNESVTDINLLKSLSESTLTEIGVSTLSDNLSLNASKVVRFENVTTRKKRSKESVKELETTGARARNDRVTALMKKVNFRKSLSLDQTLFSPPSSSSTPKYISQKSSTTSNVKTALYGRRRSKSADEGNTKISRIRMPNFAKIHEKARDKLENIVQLTERKAERARVLLSGQKPTDSLSLSKSNDTLKNSVKQSHRQLIFDKSQPSTLRGFLRVAINQNSPKNMEDFSYRSNQKAETTKIPNSNETKPGTSRTGFLKVAIPVKLRNPTRPIPPHSLGQNKVTHFGFKIKNNACLEQKVEQLKAVATKTKPQQDNREKRRTLLKGVRCNRRFELLMKMRKN